VIKKTVLHPSFHKTILLSLRSKTVFLLLLILLIFYNSQAQTERNQPSDTLSSKEQLKLDSNYLQKQENERQVDREDNRKLMQKLLKRVEEQKRWRQALIYSSTLLFIIVLGGIFFLNYWQSKQKPK
jgi:hypothetical protein